MRGERGKKDGAHLYKGKAGKWEWSWRTLRYCAYNKRIKGHAQRKSKAQTNRKRGMFAFLFLPAGVQQLVSALLWHQCIINQVLFAYPVPLTDVQLLFFLSLVLPRPVLLCKGFTTPGFPHYKLFFAASLPNSYPTLLELPCAPQSQTDHRRGRSRLHIYTHLF